jgi:hypothetical protein
MISGLPWGLALSSGVNTYLPLFLLALFARFTHAVSLSPRFHWLISDEAVIILGVLALGEVLAEKFPVVDHLWDFLHTVLRPIAGALAAGATLPTESTPELVFAMLTGGTLATAAHSAKSSVRLVSTAKSFGVANPILSLGEDIAVVAGTLLSVYAPWVMLGVVLLFALLFALFGPWLVRSLWFDLRIVAAWFRWLGRRIFRAPTPLTLRESLLELGPSRLRRLSAELEPGEELLGALSGWNRSRGLRRCWLLVTPGRVLLAEQRFLRKPKVTAIHYGDVVVARERNLVLFSKLDLLTRQNARFALTLARTEVPFGSMAAEKIRELARLSAPPPGVAPATGTNLASVIL